MSAPSERHQDPIVVQGVSDVGGFRDGIWVRILLRPGATSNQKQEQLRAIARRLGGVVFWAGIQCGAWAVDAGFPDMESAKDYAAISEGIV